MAGDTFLDIGQLASLARTALDDPHGLAIQESPARVMAALRGAGFAIDTTERG